MKIANAWLFVLFLGLALPTYAQGDTLCETHDWFRLDQQVKAGAASLLCTGAVDAAFERRTSALKRLHQVLRVNPHGAIAYRAHELLLSLYFRSGQYREALREIDAMLTEKPTAQDAIDERPLLLTLSQYPNLSIKRKRSVISTANAKDGNLHLPIIADSKNALYIVDTGANISVMSETEAHALGLTVHAVSTKITDISGAATSLQIAEVGDLIVGKTHLKHIAFLVLPESQPPFNDVPTNEQGILGIQVLLALRTIHLSKNGGVEVGGGSSNSGRATPIAFDEAQPITQISFEGKAINFTLDTGAVSTTLNPSFAKLFPHVIETGQKKEHALIGAGGSTTQDSVELNSMKLNLVGMNLDLTPAIVLLKETDPPSAWSAGNLGFDLIQRLAPFTLDFSKMELIAEPR